MKRLKTCIAQSEQYYKRKERSETPGTESDSDILSPPNSKNNGAPIQMSPYVL